MYFIVFDLNNVIHSYGMRYLQVCICLKAISDVFLLYIYKFIHIRLLKILYMCVTLGAVQQYCFEVF